MEVRGEEREPMRSVIVRTLVVCLFVAIAPWLTGGQEPLGRLISVFALLLAGLLIWRQPQVRRFAWGPMAWFGICFIGFGGLSLLWSSDRFNTWLWVLDYISAAGAFYVAYVIAGEARGRDLLRRGYLVSAGLFAVVAICMYLFGEYDRLTGTFYWPNPAAAYLIPALVLAVDAVRTARSRARLLWGAGAAGFVAVFLLTQSRAAMAVVAVVFGLYLLLYRLERRFWIHLLFILASGWVLSFGLAQLSRLTAHHTSSITLSERFKEAATGQSTSGRDRVYYLESAFEMWWDHPVGGVGAGGYAAFHPEYQKRVVSASANAHNLYVQTLAELGLVGFVLLAGILLVGVLGVIRGLVSWPLGVPIFIGLVGVLMHFALDIDAKYPAMLGLVGALGGMLYSQPRVRYARPRFALVVVMALALVPVTGLYLNSVHAERGVAAQDDADYELAIDEFGRAQTGIVIDPDFISSEGINHYARGFQGGGEAKAEFGLGLERARRAAAMDPRDGQHRQLAGRILSAQGDLGGAEGEFRAALALDSLNHPDYALDLAAVLVRAGKREEGVQVARDMLAKYPDSVVLNRQVDPTLGPTLGNLHALIGNVALERGDLATAREEARQSLGVDPKNLRGRALDHQVKMRMVPAQ